jgi:hypothetical protein
MKIYPLSRYLGLVGLMIVIGLVVLYLMPNDRKLLMVGLTGVHHMGEDFVISEFYVNGYSGGNVGKEGGGGSNVCCVMLPKNWRPGLEVDLRWSVSDWSRQNEKETKAGIYTSVQWTNLKAFVPVEKYEEGASQLYVHFFAGGRVRVISSPLGSESPHHPIQGNDRHAAESATVGAVVPSLFTEVEIGEVASRKKEAKMIGVRDE